MLLIEREASQCGGTFTDHGWPLAPDLLLTLQSCAAGPVYRRWVGGQKRKAQEEL